MTADRTFFLYADSAEELETWKEKLVLNGARWDPFLARRSLIQEDGSVYFLTGKHSTFDSK